MANVETINSASQLNTIISNNQLVIIDFKATWCGPCKVIAPFYDALADKHGSTAGVAFVKVDVDANPEVAQRYGVRSMPTFLFLKKGVEVDRVTGANRGSLTSATERLVAQAGGASGGAFGKGYKLGGDGGSAAAGAVSSGGGGSGASYVQGGRIVDYLPIGARARGWLTAIIVFVGLYLTSLFSFDAIPAAENSMFANYGKPRESNRKTGGGPGGGGGGGFGGGPRGPPGGGPGGPGGPGGRKVGTIDSIRGDGCSSGTCG